MQTINMKPAPEVGMKVTTSGFPGTVRRIYSESTNSQGQKGYMVEVQLARGVTAVGCVYAHRPGVWSLPEYSSPDESECEEIGECEECGAKDWTDEEQDTIAYSASELYEPGDDY